MPREELFQKFARLGIPDVHISKEEWLKHYANTYNIIGISKASYDEDVVFAAEDIIKIYLLREAERKQEAAATDNT